MYTKSISLLLCIILFACCSGKRHEEKGDDLPASVDLPELIEEGCITAVTLYSSTSYFQYKMQPMGYEYDLMNDFARSQGLRLKIKVAENPSRMIDILKSGEADVVAHPIPINNSLKQDVIYCGTGRESSQVLIQRANKGDKPITDVTQLIGKQVYVKARTKYSERIKNLNEELGGGIDIKLVENDSLATEDLIEMVSKGDIPYTISDDNVARLNKTYFWNLNVSFKVSFPQRSFWIVRKGSPKLAKAIDDWSSGKTGKHSFKAITKRYFELSKRPFTADILEIKDGHISPFDSLFIKHSKGVGFDWRLIASISYQESRFNPDVVSWAGAEGLMGIMPNTARALGVTPNELKDPDTGIRTGVDCLRRFAQGFSQVSDADEKLKFTLAAYNAGIGHVYDARRLAEKYGKDPNKWDGNVAEYIRLKNDPEYYNDPVCKHGYLRGSETFFYVKEVLERYEYYRKNHI